MIYVTGDTHGEQSRFDYLATQGELSWTKDDCLIVCGDFGYLFRDSSVEHIFLNSLENKPYTICFVDGNHENFDKINAYPTEKWNGGFVHRIRKNVLHLMRGQIFEIEGKKIFTMGGGYSRDRYMRVLGKSYWRDEMPSDAEYKLAIANLKSHNFSVDYIITHTAPTEIIRYMRSIPDPHEIELNGFLEWVMYETKFKRWYFGHWHNDKEITDKFKVMCFEVDKLE